MKIGIVITDMTKGGGMERVTALLSNQFDALGMDMEIISLIRENERSVYDLGAGVKCTYLMEGRYDRRQSRIKRLRGQANMFFRFRRYIKSDPCDIYIAQGFLPAIFLYMSGKGGKTIVCEHFKYELYSGRAVLYARNHIYRRLRTVVTLTEADAAKFKLHKVNAIVIPNMSTFPIAGAIAKGVNDSKRILCVGRLEPQKGFDLLVEAIGKIRSEMRGWEIDIFGEGSQRQLLSDLIHRYGCDGIINLKGYSSRIDYDNYSFMVVSSRFEGFSMAIIESLAKGLPVVSYDCPEGPGKLLSGDVGILVEKENVELLSGAILKMAYNPELRNEFAAKGLVRASEYSPGRIMSQWMSVINTHE